MACAPEHVPLIDHRTFDSWDGVRQTRYWMHQRFHYAYPGPIRELRQRLIIAPADHYGDQQLRAFQLHVSAPGASTSSSTDAFGNRVVFVYAPRASAEVTFEMRLVIERDLSVNHAPRLTRAEAALFLAPSRLVPSDERTNTIARTLAAQHAAPLALAEAINSWVHGALHYGAGATHVGTTATEALAIGKGLCQDYAHVMIAVCHAAQIPARYVSGHMLGEGGSHAWVEVLLPTPNGASTVIAFDPTNHRRATPAYITIAVGRDYGDVSPTSGSFIAPYSGALTASKRAGLTHINFHSAAC